MWQSYFNGLLVTAGLIMAIGAQNAFVLAQSLRREHHLPVALLCICSDILLVSLGVFGLAAIIAESPVLLQITRWGGVAFLLWYGTLALRRAVRPGVLREEIAASRSLRSVLLAALAVTFLNPHVYLDTVLLIGSLGAQQPEPGAYTVGAASASALWFLLLALGGAWLAPWLARPLTWRLIDLGVACMMFAIAAQLIVMA
ncbi:LysE/ArgO family amino acid transporter [Stutzerimonas nitrititolerans]|uniref:LysE/ArgO family amino acid transporter n=1 Tax=Stutzerimonas nitrititolerans TaxID=2482751 RepID=UPI000F7A82E6|nr:LysE/ArgO family amino acid transporter [Stutzerimonas nitrititolerans]RRV25123.1 amino acid transporter [Pseudomonas sp. s199]